MNTPLMNFGARPLSPLDPQLPTARWWPLERFLRWRPLENEVFKCQACAHSKELLASLQADIQQREVRSLPSSQAVDVEPLWDFPQYQQRMNAVVEAIGRGEIYQANLTMPWKGRAHPA